MAKEEYPGALRVRRLEGNRGLLFAEGDLFGRAECLATDTFGDLLDFPTGFEECSNLGIDRIAGFNGWGGLGFGGGGFNTHGCH